MFLGFAGAVFVISWLTIRHWNQLNSNDLGSMSKQWLAEYNAEHP
ncbi:MAG: hypothetical protein RLZZ53_2564 [Acidobacteriota bacterium]|jgi:hypothetical protein